MAAELIDLAAFIRAIPDWPVDGVTFRDVAPLLADPRAFSQAVRQMADHGFGDFDLVAGIEARGFVFGAAMAMTLGIGFVPMRKVGKLPPPTVRRDYALEYGTASLEVPAAAFVGASAGAADGSAIEPVIRGARVLLVDDVLATGGTAGAGVELIRHAGGEPVGLSVLIELPVLGGRAALDPDLRVQSLLTW